MGSKYKYKLSIIVPVYNVELYLERCVMSLLNQDMDPNQYEIILVNDGSTDGSGDIARRFKNNYPIVQLVEQTNGGLSAARNRGLDFARGKYIMFVDSDDFIEANVIGGLVTRAEKFDLDALFYDSRFYPYETRQTARQPFEKNVVFSGDYAVTHGLFIGAVWSNLYSHDFLKITKVIFLEGIVHEDIDFNCRLLPQAKRIMFTDVMVYNYSINTTSLTRGISFEQIQKSLVDDLCVVARVKSFAKTNFQSAEVKNVIVRKMNSTMIGNLIAIGKNHIFDFDFIKKYISLAEQQQVYPIEGRSLSPLTTLIIPLLNIKCFYFFIIKVLRLIK